MERIKNELLLSVKAEASARKRLVSKIPTVILTAHDFYHGAINLTGKIIVERRSTDALSHLSYVIVGMHSRTTFSW